MGSIFGICTAVAKHHTFFTLEGIINNTLAASKYITGNFNLFGSFSHSFVSSWSSRFLGTNIHRSKTWHINHIIGAIHMVFTHITQITAAINITSNISAQDRLINFIF